MGGDPEFHFGHVKFDMPMGVQTEMWSSLYIFKSGVQGSRAGRVARKRARWGQGAWAGGERQTDR